MMNGEFKSFCMATTASDVLVGARFINSNSIGLLTMVVMIDDDGCYGQWNDCAAADHDENYKLSGFVPVQRQYNQ
jgi:hypothetical protein